MEGETKLIYSAGKVMYISPAMNYIFHFYVRSVGNRGAGGATAPSPHFSWKLTKIAEKYGFFLKIHVFCPPTFGLAPPLLRKFLHPCIELVNFNSGLLSISN